MNEIIAYFQQSSEYKNWGLNLATISAICTVFFTVLQWYGAHDQWKKIRIAKSTESISVTFFVFINCYFYAFLRYGICFHKLAIIINGLLGIIYTLILIEIIRYHKFTIFETICLALSAFNVLLMIILNNHGKEILLTVDLAILTVFSFSIIRELKLSGKRGTISLKYLIIAISTNVFWLIYSMTISNVQLIVANLFCLIVYARAIQLYQRYAKEEKFLAAFKG